jgi:hypothetical protein|tara:strand:- start:60 stop:1028 length:969 start_codon:yes stop_codon:yes gene_type:complete
MIIITKLIAQSDFERPIPDFSNVGVDINVETITLKLSQILIDDKEGNTARNHGTSESDIESLKHSLSKGWDTTEYLPCVYENPNKNSEYTHILAYGYNRANALELLYGGNFEMVFDVVTCTESQLLDIRTMENEGLPKVNNKEIDVVKTMMQKIEKFGFKKDTDEIRKHLDLICPFRSKQSKDSIVRQIENLAALDTAVYEWNPSKAKRWSKDYSSIKYNFDGELTGNTHTFMCKQGSTYRTYHRMMSRYLETGNPCQVLFHVSRPTKKSSIEAKRQRTMEDWNSGLKRLNDLGCRTDFMSVAGFLPQEKGKDNWSQLVKIK